MKVFEKPKSLWYYQLHCWIEYFFSFSGGPLESRAGWDLCEPILRKLISIKLLPNWHTGFMTTLYLHTIEFRYLHWYTIEYICFQEFQIWPDSLQNNSERETTRRRRSKDEFFFCWFESRWKEWFAARCWLMPRLQSRLCVVFAPFVSPRFPQRTRDNRQTSRSATPHNEPRLHHTGKCICTYTGIAIQVFKHNLSNATAYTQSSHI